MNQPIPEQMLTKAPPDRFSTHVVNNQAAMPTGFNAFEDDVVLKAAIAREAPWAASRCSAIGRLAGDEAVQELARQANRNIPELKTHDRYGNRIDWVDFHPAWHQLMAMAWQHEVPSLSWSSKEKHPHYARAVLSYLWNQVEQGTGCPTGMAYAGFAGFCREPALKIWADKSLSTAYENSRREVADKPGVVIGYAMTEKQGGSDLRANSSVAVRDGDSFLLTGHKWFCSAPMCDAFLALARLDDRVSCFLVPRSLPDGTRNPFYLQRLKDKIGNKSNASSEIEFRNTLAWIVGPEGRGIATLIEMAHLTRFDIVVATAGMMRAGLTQALHHCEHRAAFGKRLAEHEAMQNVLADLALESEAATLTAFRLAEAFDRGLSDANERLLARIMTPVAKYWLCKRNPVFTVEAMECLGGNGFTEDGPFGRLFRESPLNGIWEGSGNVICLDVLRSVEREPESLRALLAEIRAAAPEHPALRAVADRLEKEFADRSRLEARARRLVELAATALQASLMLRHADPRAAAAFCASRLAGDWGHVLGTLPAGTDGAALAARLRLQ